jgi:hypothetical protein
MERNPQMQALAKRVQARGAGPRGAAPASGRSTTGASAPATAVATLDGADPEAASSSTEAMDRARARRTASGPRNQPKKQRRADRH